MYSPIQHSSARSSSARYSPAQQFPTRVSAPLATTATMGANRWVLFALLAALILTISAPAAADKHHDRHHGQQYVYQGGKHQGHPVHKHHPRYVQGPKHHSKNHPKHHNRHYDKHHHSAPRHTSAQGFSLNIWGLSPLLSNHHRSVSTSFHYHGQERCYHRH